MLEQDRQTVRAELEKYRAERWITDPAPEQLLEEGVLRSLDELFKTLLPNTADRHRHHAARAAVARPPEDRPCPISAHRPRSYS